MEIVRSIPKELISKTSHVDCRTPISEVASHLKRYPAIVITKGKEYHGIVDSRTIYRKQQRMKLPTSTKIERFSAKVPRITKSTPIYDVANYFYKSGTKALPYYDGNRIIGVLERRTFMKVLLSLDVLGDVKVTQAMTTPLLAIDANASIAQAKSTMRERKVNRLVVLQNGRFVGLITNYDIVNSYTQSSLQRVPEMKTKIYKPANVPLSSVMKHNVSTINYNRSVSDAVREMVEKKISSIIVTKGNDPVGVLTVTDVLESALARQKVEASKIFLSGFDQQTYQYEDWAREELALLIDSVEKLSGIDVDYITFKVKGTKTKLYEMQARMSLGRHGIITIHTNKYLFEDALNDLMKKLKNKVIKEKESIITHKKVNTLRDAIE